MPWYLYLALKQLFPTGKRFHFFTAISMLGVALGVALLVISTSVMGGFGYEIREMIVNTQGDIQVQSSTPIDNADSLQEKIAAVPGVVATTPIANGAMLLKFGGSEVFPAMQGVDLNRVTGVLPKIASYVRPLGSLDNLDDDSVILSALLAQSIGARVGDTVLVYSLRMVKAMDQNAAVLPSELKVVGIFEIGHQQLDSSVVLVTLRKMQELAGIGNTVRGIDVRISPGADPDVVADRINAALPPIYRALSWKELNQDFLWILQLEQNMIFFLLTFIIVVAAFSVTSSLLISVVRKTREIGILGAIGARPLQIAACFCFQGFLIGIGGTIAGLALGFGLLSIRDRLIGVFTALTRSQAVLARFYQFSRLPSHPQPGYILTIVICSIVICTLAGMVPAWRAARLKPVEALRSE